MNTGNTDASPPTRISFINSLCVERDAISMAVRDEIAALQTEQPFDSKLFAYRCEYSDLPFVAVQSVADVLFHRHFQTSDIVIAHFGVRYPLFDVLPLAPRRATRIVVFHNVTPKDHSPRSSHHEVEVSLRQISNAQWADHVFCDSMTNLEMLRGSGVSTPASVVPLAVHTSAIAPPTKPSHRDGVVRIVFIGRFVKSKGVLDLLRAIGELLGNDAVGSIRLDLIGNTEFSNPSILARVQSHIDALRTDIGRKVSVELVGDASEAAKGEVLQSADLFVLPTYHEGFCVPILEAIAAGCRVITYDNSNAGSVGGALSTLVPTGDLGALGVAIQQATEQIRSDEWRGTGSGSYRAYARTCGQYVQDYAPAVVRARFRKLLLQVHELHRFGTATGEIDVHPQVVLT